MIPTPTPWPTPGPALVDLPEWRVWTFADDAVGAWNRFGGERTQMIQWLVIVIIVVVATLIFAALIRRLSNEGEQE